MFFFELHNTTEPLTTHSLFQMGSNDKQTMLSRRETKLASLGAPRALLKQVQRYCPVLRRRLFHSVYSRHLYHIQWRSGSGEGGGLAGAPSTAGAPPKPPRPEEEEEEGRGARGRSWRREPPWLPALASPLTIYVAKRILKIISQNNAIWMRMLS
jgi:hypothetical protein